MFAVRRIIRKPKARSSLSRQIAKQSPVPLPGSACNACAKGGNGWLQTIKNRVLLENDFLPGDLERQIGAIVDHYNIHRYHESLDNLTPANVYHGRGAKILTMREEIKLRRTTSRKRRLQRQAAAA